MEIFVSLITLGKLAHNVLNMRRSSPSYKKTEGFWWAGMWVRENRTKP